MTSELHSSPTLDSEVENGGPSNPRHGHAAGRRRSSQLVTAFRMPPGLSPAWRWALGVLLIIQIAVITTAGIFCAFHLRYFSPSDEEAHYSYIQQVAEHGTLPVLGKTETSPQALAIALGVYPRQIVDVDTHIAGLGRLSYEAFQPPLYYYAAAPAFLITSNYVDKIYSVRVFDIILLLVAVALTGRLCRVVLNERWLIGWSITLVFFALPGVVVRFAYISNLALAIPISVLFLTELWIAWDRHSVKRLAGAGLVLGLCVLTELELLCLIPVFAFVVVAEGRRRWTPGTWHPLVITVVVPLVVMAPWFLFNEANYHLLTAGSIAIKEQTSIINPHHLHYSITELPNETAEFLVDPTLPAEWGGALGGDPALSYLDELLAVLILPAGLVLIAGTGRRLWSMRTAILGLPYLFNVVEMWYIRYVEQWAVFVRYTFATFPILLTLVADATGTIRTRYLPVLVSAGATLSIIVIWGYFLVSYTGTYSFR